MVINHWMSSVMRLGHYQLNHQTRCANKHLQYYFLNKKQLGWESHEYGLLFFIKPGIAFHHRKKLMLTYR
jgi:hypothetical protein